MRLKNNAEDLEGAGRSTWSQKTKETLASSIRASQFSMTLRKDGTAAIRSFTTGKSSKKFQAVALAHVRIKLKKHNFGNHQP